MRHSSGIRASWRRFAVFAWCASLGVSPASAAVQGGGGAAGAERATSARAAEPVAGDWLARCAPFDAEPWCVEGTGFVLDSSHPKLPDDARRFDARLRIACDPVPGELALELVLIEDGKEHGKTYFARRGRVFQVDEAGAEVALGRSGDLSAAAVAALHPRTIAWALAERRQAWSELADGALAFAWSDSLWRVQVDGRAGSVLALSRSLPHEQYGDGLEEIRFELQPEGAGALAARTDSSTAASSDGAVRASVLQRGREIARFDFGPRRVCEPPVVPAGDPARNASHAVSARSIELVPIAPGLFTIDLVELDTRMVVAEFEDHVVVLEGAFNSRVCDLVARAVEARLAKPVRYFSFSHLHAQYLGGVRSWIHAGATVLCPPTTVPLVERVASGPHALRPDALAAEPRELRVQAVAERLSLADARNALDVYNVPSGHTDEYFLFHFPRQRIVVSGDLLFYRPGQPLTGRSRLFCETVRELGLEFGAVYCTWPLGDSYGTRDVVTREELLAAYAAKQ